MNDVSNAEIGDGPNRAMDRSLTENAYLELEEMIATLVLAATRTVTAACHTAPSDRTPSPVTR